MNDDIGVVETDEGKLARSVTRLGDTAQQLTDVLGQVDENQKTLLKLRLDVGTLRDKTEMDTIRLETQNQIAKVRNKTAVLVIVIMLIASIVGSLSYAKVRSDSSNAVASAVSSFAAKNRCQIDFNSHILTILKERGKLDTQDQTNLRVLLEKIAIPGTTYEEGQVFRREYIAKSLVVQSQRDALVFPKGSC